MDKRVTVRLTAKEFKKLSKLKGETTSEKIRYAIKKASSKA